MKTTDNQNELFNIVDEQDNVIGTATRREVHANKKLIHRSVGVLVFNSKGELLLQQRSSTKDTDPLKWTISCSGHVLSGDTYEQTAKRELSEELGIAVPIIYMMKYVCRTAHESEMQAVYKAYCDGPFTYHPQEIVQGKFFTQKELMKALQESKIELSIMAKMVLVKTGWI